MNKNDGIVNIKGRDYMTVARRVSDFREKHPDWPIITELVYRDAETVVMKATIADADHNVLGTGYAEENRKASQINRTSALENCETSAIGRALANIGLAGTEYASADELAGAILKQEIDKTVSDIKTENEQLKERLTASKHRDDLLFRLIIAARYSWDEFRKEYASLSKEDRRIIGKEPIERFRQMNEEDNEAA